VSQRLPITVLENAVSNAERRALAAGEPVVVPRVTDIFAALPSLTGKIELEYEGELRGAEQVARELVRGAVATIFDPAYNALDTRSIVDWFDMGGEIDLGDMAPAADLIEKAREVQGLLEAAQASSARPVRSTEAASEPQLAAGIDFVLEGLCALKRISRADSGKFSAIEPRRQRATPNAGVTERIETFDEDETMPRGRKKYYN
jgi:magnesium chelatase subunit I